MILISEYSILISPIIYSDSQVNHLLIYFNWHISLLPCFVFTVECHNRFCNYISVQEKHGNSRIIVSLWSETYATLQQAIISRFMQLIFLFFDVQLHLRISIIKYVFSAKVYNYFPIEEKCWNNDCSLIPWLGYCELDKFENIHEVKFQK